MSISSKAHQRANLIHRCFLTKDPATLIRAFIVYVRPILEYCSSVWSPSLITDIDCIEKVQRRFTKRLAGLYDLNYGDRLIALGIDSLERRRLNADLILTYKIVFNLIDLQFNDFFVFNTNSLRGHRYKLFMPRYALDVRKHFFSQRVINPWNNLDPVKTNFQSLSTFKRSLSINNISPYLIFK